jgi:signal transduction histidine kinase/CheY-like chemotaxis protein/PAS domain-containing protein
MKAELIRGLNRYFLVLHILMGILYACIHIMRGIQYTPFVIVLSCVVAVVLLKKIKNIRDITLSLIQSSNIAFLLLSIVFLTGGSAATCTIWIFPVLFYVFIVNEEKHSTVFFIILTICLGIIFALESQNLLPINEIPIAERKFLTSLNLILSLLVCYYLLRKNGRLVNIHANEVLEIHKRNDMIIEGGGTAVYDWGNTSSDEVYWSPKLYEILGYKDGEIPPSAAFFTSQIFKEDLIGNETKIAEQLKVGNTFSTEFRLLQKNGTILWVKSYAIVTKDENGFPIRIVGAVHNNDELIRNRKKLEESTIKLDVINSSLQNFIDRHPIEDIFKEMLIAITKLAECDLGIIVEVMSSKQLKTLATVSKDNQHGLESHDLNKIFSSVLAISKPFIANEDAKNWNPNEKEESIKINNFLAIPIQYGNSLIGIIGLANCNEGFSLSDKKKLHSFTKTISILINAYRELEEKKAYEKELREQKDAAEVASKAKSNFLANMTHEIRTPLNGIIGLTDVLASRLVDSEHNEILKDIERSGTHLLDVITDILDFSKIEHDKIVIVRSHECVVTLLQELNSIYFELCKKKGIHFSLDTSKIPDLFFYLDKIRVKQVLNNLLSNSLKFTHEGSIKLEAVYSNNKLSFIVSDTGIGIAKDEFKTIFHAFHQTDLTLQKSYTGTGLGLTISKELVALMDGEFSIDSELGKGSSFKINLTIDEPMSKEQLPTQSSVIEVDFDIKPFQKYKYLVVEDIPLNLKVLSSFLNGFGLTFDTAVNGLEAIEKLQKNHYDFIFMDIQMPKLDGISATTRIRKFNEDVFIVALTANAFDEAKESALKSGMNYFLSKPIKRKDITVSLNEFKKFLNKGDM